MYFLTFAHDNKESTIILIDKYKEDKKKTTIHDAILELSIKIEKQNKKKNT